ncbi:hypothetical protein NM208_g5838 [Fusarium decemcellulare]|uniref:Uncharacterized protein n=1 Tax=Fusarium decemcellulare TaxID=57161 RepID=A0ACC1SFF3_9HYPO|nr:hypothetical protein NM208_g5838 [Fusarium decemcellulare]
MEVAKRQIKLNSGIAAWKIGIRETFNSVGPEDYITFELTGAVRAVTAALASDESLPVQMLEVLDDVTINKVTLELMRKFNGTGDSVFYNTYQAYLKKTTANVVNHLAEARKGGFRLGFKVIDDSYNSIAQGALKRQLGDVGASGSSSVPFPSVKLLLCSHNKESLSEALDLYQERTRKNLPTTPVAFAQLHGMSHTVTFSLLQ